MKEKLFALFWVLFFALPLYAQADKTGSYSIKGQVLDSLSNESVQIGRASCRERV